MSWIPPPTNPLSKEIERIQPRESDIIAFHNYQLARILPGRNRVAQKIPTPCGLCRIHGSFGGKHATMGPSPSGSGSEPSTGDSSPVKRNRIIFGESCNTPIISTSRRYGFTRYCALTELPTGKQKWISSDNLRENNRNLP
jgi:hypothetical protein